MALNKGDIVLVQFPFSNLSQTKLRPALILAVSKTIDKITLSFISSQNAQSLTSTELIILILFKNYLLIFSYNNSLRLRTQCDGYKRLCAIKT